MASSAKRASKRATKWLKANRNGGREKCKMGTARVSYCPECKASDMTRPQTAPKVFCNDRTRVGHCPSGHSWAITGSLYTTSN